MLLSRIFSLLLGTTLFVMIWSMQDGDHNLRLRVDRANSPRSVQPEFHEAPARKPIPTITKQPVRVTSVSVTNADSAMWVFADEPVERVAGK